MKLDRRQTAQLLTLVDRFHDARQDFTDPDRPNVEASRTLRTAAGELAAFTAETIREALEQEQAPTRRSGWGP